MKKVSDYLIAGLCIISLAFSGGALYKAQAATNNIEQNGQPIDLTYAAKKALPAVLLMHKKIRSVVSSSTPSVSSVIRIKGKEAHANKKYKHPKKKLPGLVLLLAVMDISSLTTMW